MASDDATPGDRLSTDAIIDLMVLAYSRSEIGEVGNATLRASIRGQFRMMHRGESIDLEPLWWILADHPKFKPELATPPACKFKTWEKFLGYEVRLPMALFEADDQEIARHAKAVDIPDQEVRDLIAKHKVGSQSAVQTDRASHKSDSNSAAAAISGKVLALAGAALLLFAISGYMIYSYIGQSSFEETAADFASLPVKSPRKLGTQVAVTLTDPSWRSKSPEEKKGELKQALEAASPSGITGIIVLTEAKKPVASVALDGDTSKVIYNLR